MIILNETISHGEKKQVIIEPDVLGYEIPTTLICGKESGQTLLITAQIHSGEYPATPATILLAKEIDPLKVKGNIIIMHCVNTSGFYQHSSGVIPEDRYNLNGDYPGQKNGTTGQAIAHFFIEKVFPIVDFIIDMHSGGIRETLTPCLFYPLVTKEKSLEVASALNIPYLIASHAKSGECSYAAHQFHIPGLLLERGFGGRCEKDWIQDYYVDLRLALNQMGMYAYNQENVCEKFNSLNNIYLTSHQRGLWYPSIHHGEYIKKDQLLGQVEDFFGNVIERYYAIDDGIVFYYTHCLAVREGYPLVAYGLKKDMKKL